MSAINVNSITGRTGSHGPVLTGVTTISGELHVGSGVSFSGIGTYTNGLNVTSGRVGIGTDNPLDYKLHIQESTSAIARFERTGGAFAKVDIKAGSSTGNSYLTFSDTDANEVGEINYEHEDNSLRFTVNSDERLRITSDGELELRKNQNGVTGRPDNRIIFKDTDTSVAADQPIGEISWYSTDAGMDNVNSYIRGINEATNGSGALTFGIKASGSSEIEALRITSGGGIGIGTDDPASKLHVNEPTGSGQLRVSSQANPDGVTLTARNDGTGSQLSARGTSSHLRFYTTDSSDTLTERMRIQHQGIAQFRREGISGNPGYTTAGVAINDTSSGSINLCRDGDQPVFINRLTNDGNLILFAQDTNNEGAIVVSGSNVTLNGATLSRWSQLAGGAERTEILRGSVLSNLNEMCEWGDEDNEQMNRMKVSDVEGDVNVAGVFMGWDDDDDTYTNDFYCAMTGDFVIRIAQGTTVARGDLLMSAGDGTAKPQDDDIVRSKTVAKVTSTTVSTTYADGSYCVPCVLMAC